MQYESWCALTDAELARRDVGEVNLACAFGLPGSEGLDIPACRAQLDHWANLVKLGTRNLLPKFRRSPGEHGSSEAVFRIRVMATILQRNLGVKYFEEFKTGDFHGCDSRTQFIHGLLSGHGGTCVSMPPLYLAIGRRLGYPLKLAEAREHLFVRWDDPTGERFNIESTSVGFDPHDDDYYHHWPKPITSDEMACGFLLRNMTPREELAYFLAVRGLCWRDHLRTEWALEAFYYARQLAPRHPIYQAHAAVGTIMHRIMEDIRAGGLPKNLPLSEILFLTTAEPTMEWERKVIPIAHREIERIYNRRVAEHRAKAREQAFATPVS